MIKNYKLLLLLLFICCTGNSFAQYGASDYTFSENTAGTYTAITGTTTGAFGDDACDNLLPIGFTFNFAGTTYTDFSVSTNGFLTLGTGINCNNTPTHINYFGGPNGNLNLYTPMIAGFWDDNSIPNGTGSIQYLTQGTPGSQTLTVQWTNMVFSTGGTTPYMDFQIILYETSDIIEIVYGGTSQASVSRSAAIGIESIPGDFMSVAPSTLGATYSTVTPKNNVTISSTSALPSGLTYTFTPPPPCSGAPTAGSAVASSQALCPGQAFTISLSGGTVATGLTFDWQYDDGSGWQSTGGTNGIYSSTFTFSGPVDFRCIVECGGLLDTSQPVTVSPASFINCYCSPLNGTQLYQYGSDYLITGVDIPTTTLNYSNSTYNNSGYEQFIPPAANQTDTFFPGLTYTINVGLMYSWLDAGVWIDWDMDGAFDNSSGSAEWVAMTLNSNGATGTFTVPSTAVAGATGLRVRVADAYFGPFGPSGLGSCSDAGYGETEDYMIFIGTLYPCSGTPNPAAISGPSNICPSVDFTLVAMGMSIGLGITYDWQYDDGSGWQTTGGAGTMYNQTGGITVPTDYRLITYCANSNQYDTSNVLSVGVNDFYACYCSPLNGTTLSQDGVYGNYITGVEISNTTLNNSTTSYNSNGYQQFIPPAANQTDTFFPGITYTINIGIMSPQWQYGGVWIDWDMDGTFDNSSGSAEWVAMTGTSTGATGTFTVPSTAVAGATGLRVRVNDYGNQYGPSGLDPCDDDGSGETEDYMIFIGTLYPCAGTPVPAAISGVTDICPAIDFTLAASGMSIGLGITYDWQYDDGSGWQTTGGAGTTYTQAGGITVPTNYRLITYCANSNQYDTSAVHSVAVNDFYACYCSPLNGTTLYQYGSDDLITGVDVPSTTLNYSNSTYNNNGYEQFIPPAANQTDTFFPGLTYTINVGLMYSWLDAGVWIDWDMDGAFDNSSGSAEWVAMTLNSNGATGTFTVPSTAVAGATGLRVRVADAYFGPFGPSGLGSCSDAGYGETEDYMIFVGVLNPCTGTPNPAVISGSTNTCPSIDFTLVAMGMSIGLGITYDWQYDDGSGWQTTGGSGTTYTQAGGITVSTDYRLITYCANSNQYDTSNVLSVAVNDFYACYCSPLNGTTLSQYGAYGNFITRVEVPTTTLNNPTTSYNNNGYQSFYPPAANQTDTFFPGVTYTINIGIMSPQWQYGGVWIDWDMDGTFDNSSGSAEWVAMTGTSTGATGTFTVPSTAVAGATGLRVRVNDYGNQYGPTGTGPCNDDDGGETEDYVIFIGVLNSCSGAPNSAVISGPTNICPAIDFTLVANGMSIALGITYDWQYDDGSGWQTTGGSATTYTQAGGITVSTDYRLITYCANSNQYDTSNVLSVAVNDFYACYCSPVTDGTILSQYGVYANFITNVSIASTTLNNSTSSYNSNGYQSFYPPAASATASLPAGTTYTLNVGMLYTYPWYAIGAWMDFDGNGLFDNNTEFIPLTFTTSNNGSPGIATGSFTVPAGATQGMAGLRVRMNSWPMQYGGSNLGACDDDNEGETEDYVVTITNTPTAIRLDKLSAVNVGASNRVEWNTFGEERSDKFELERSADGKNFAKIYEKQANGAPSRYTYMDNTPVKGMNYYRLRMTEANGKAAYSEVVKAFVSSTGFEVDAFPNPVSHDLTVRVSGVQGADAAVQVTDVTGKLIRSVKMTSNVETIDMSGLANGIYLIKYSDANHTQTIKVNKQ